VKSPIVWLQKTLYKAMELSLFRMCAHVLLLLYDITMYVRLGMRGGYRGGGRLWNDYEFNYNSVGVPRNTRGRVSPYLLSCAIGTDLLGANEKFFWVCHSFSWALNGDGMEWGSLCSVLSLLLLLPISGFNNTTVVILHYFVLHHWYSTWHCPKQS